MHGKKQQNSPLNADTVLSYGSKFHSMEWNSHNQLHLFRIKVQDGKIFFFNLMNLQLKKLLPENRRTLYGRNLFSWQNLLTEGP